MSDLPDALRSVTEAAAEKAQAAGYTQRSISPGTEDHYEKRVARWVEWCDDKGVSPLGASPELLATFLEDLRQREELAHSTLKGYVTAITWQHEQQRLPSPGRSRLVRRYLQYFQESSTTKSRRGGCTPLYADDMRQIIDAILPDRKKDIIGNVHNTDLEEEKGVRPIDLRDRALLLVAYVSALHQSQVVHINHEHLHPRPRGYLLRLPSHSVDERHGHEAKWRGIPKTDRLTCPAKALTDWVTYLYRQGYTDGPIFRSMRSNDRLRRRSVLRIVKKRVSNAGLNPDKYSTHSLRAGMISQAGKSGAAASQILRQTGVSSPDGIENYLEEGDALDNLAVKALGL